MRGRFGGSGGSCAAAATANTARKIAAITRFCILHLNRFGGTTINPPPDPRQPAPPLSSQIFQHAQSYNCLHVRKIPPRAACSSLPPPAFWPRPRRPSRPPARCPRPPPPTALKLSASSRNSSRSTPRIRPRQRDHRDHGHAEALPRCRFFPRRRAPARTRRPQDEPRGAHQGRRHADEKPVVFLCHMDVVRPCAPTGPPTHFNLSRRTAITTAAAPRT